MVSTILETYHRDRVVNWAIIFSKMVAKQLSMLNGATSTSCCPFLIHVYRVHNLLGQIEIESYDLVATMWECNELDPDVMIPLELRLIHRCVSSGDIFVGTLHVTYIFVSTANHFPCLISSNGCLPSFCLHSASTSKLPAAAPSPHRG